MDAQKIIKGLDFCHLECPHVDIIIAYFVKYL